MKMKRCKKCQLEYPASPDYFHRASSNKDGLHRVCKECRRETERQRKRCYYATHKEEVLEKNKEYYQKNKTAIRQQQKEYREKWKEEDLEGYQASTKAYALKWREKHQEEYNEYMQSYIKRYRSTYRGRMITRISNSKWQSRFWHDETELLNDFTFEDWLWALDCFNNSCAYCGSRHNLLPEHVESLAKSNDYRKTNIVPSCRTCNDKKKQLSIDQFYQLQVAFTKERYEYIKAYQQSLITKK